jgi:sulfotransferase family protein
MLPNLIIIGAMKCGTSSLHLYLGRVPGVFMAEQKELDFFKTKEDFRKGIDWYESKFPDTYQIRGEASPNYTKRHIFPSVAERIASVIPDVKLIYIVRNPIKRAVSHYRHNLAHGREKRPINDALSITDKNNYLLSGLYYFQLNPFLDHFSQNQILILAAEDLNYKRLDTVNYVLEFLKVSKTTSEAMFSDRANETKNKVQYTSVGRLIHDIIPNERLRKYVPFRQTLKRLLLTRPLPEENLDKALEEKIVDFYIDDVHELEKLTGLSFSFWFK